MIDHISLTVSDLHRSRDVYDRTLPPLGARRMMDVDDAPGLRREHHPNDHAAFVIDPDGHHIEAVCHKPE